jgi:Na+/melibiose symporter-like transporter
VIIPILFLWAMVCHLLFSWFFRIKRRKYDMNCRFCGCDLSQQVNKTIATGKCRKCGKELFEREDEEFYTPALQKNKEELISLNKIISRRLYISVPIFIVLFIAALLAAAFFSGFFIHSIRGQDISFLGIGLLFVYMYGVVFYEKHKVRKEGFFCPSCKRVIGIGLLHITLETGNCGHCGRKLFRE